jgi:tRNA(fMet)-specific endonuclease VapC
MMAPRYLLDTNICIYIRRHRPPEVFERFGRLKAGQATMSVITWGELLYGAEKSRDRVLALRRLDELVALLPVMPLAPEVGRAHGAIRRALEATGETIGNNDLWIAAHARAANLILVTNNEREFKRVPALKVQNWVANP